MKEAWRHASRVVEKTKAQQAAAWELGSGFRAAPASTTSDEYAWRQPTAWYSIALYSSLFLCPGQIIFFLGNCSASTWLYSPNDQHIIWTSGGHVTSPRLCCARPLAASSAAHYKQGEYYMVVVSTGFDDVNLAALASVRTARTVRLISRALPWCISGSQLKSSFVLYIRNGCS
jgi:hypothetical protein